jgi:hypothetical protein
MKGIGLPPVRVVSDDNPDEWVEIKAKLTRGDQQAYTDQIMKLTREGTVNVETLDWQTPLLELAIVGWNLFDEEGKAWGYRRERVRELPADLPIIEKVAEAIAAANPFFGLMTGKSATNG